MPSKPVAILTDATNGFKNNVRRMRSGTLWDQPRTKGKENRRRMSDAGYLRRATVPDVFVTNASHASVQNDPHKWDAVDGKIIIKVHVPFTDDIWRFRVTEDVSLVVFHQKVEAKVGFPVVLGLSASDAFSEKQFQHWVARRVRNGRNTPMTARPAWAHVQNTPSF